MYECFNYLFCYGGYRLFFSGVLFLLEDYYGDKGLLNYNYGLVGVSCLLCVFVLLCKFVGGKWKIFL